MALNRLRLVYIVPVTLLAAAIAAWLVWRLVIAPVPGPLRIAPARFSDLPGWAATDPSLALAAFGRSCTALARRPPAATMGAGGYGGTVADWLPACAAVPTGPVGAAAARMWFERWFEPAAVSAGRVHEGLFTGYYEPLIKGSHARHGPYQTPVYGVPDDLIRVDLGRFRPEWAHDHLAGRLKGHELVPYPDRAQIDAAGLKTAPVLFYAADPISLFFLQIQGSGIVEFADGSRAAARYGAQNGRPYTAIGRTLIKEGAIARDQVSLQSIRAWLQTHKNQARRVMETDQSYVFFRLRPIADPALGSPGTEGVDLTPRASLAVDPRLHPLGAPFFVVTTVPAADPDKPARPYARLLVAQDTGGAIGGAVRGDVFWGHGKAAQEIAGRMKSRGRLYVLLPKPVAARLGRGRTIPGTAP